MQEPETPRWRSDERVRVGVSSCLLGERVRFDGGHKRDAWLTDVFGEYVEWVPVCPEVEVGMGTPRGVDPASTGGARRSTCCAQEWTRFHRGNEGLRRSPGG